MPLPTTRRERYVYRRNKYLAKHRHWERWKRKRTHGPYPGSDILYVKPWAATPVLMDPDRVHQRSWAESEGPFGHSLIPHTHTGGGRPNAPHVKITWVPYLLQVADGHHSKGALVGFHKRRVHGLRRLSTIKRSKLDRQITGCNWYYFREGYFKDDDILGRRPNETDRLNGVPSPGTLWPVPLGYT